MNYRQHVSARETPQSQPIAGSAQVPNAAGGYAYPVTDWVRLDRFLVLGTEGGTYYASEQKLTVANAEAVLRCIKEDGQRVVDRVVEISDGGRARSNDPALFVLAMCAGAKEEKIRRAALAVLPKVARIGTHLFHFAEFVEGFRGWGRALKSAVADWYNQMPVERLAYQLAKYRQRDGWSHKDLLRLSHPRPLTQHYGTLYERVTGTRPRRPDFQHPAIKFFLAADSARQGHLSEDELIEAIANHGLTREMVASEYLKSPKVWEALLEKMPLGALVRNLGNLSKVGLLAPGQWSRVSQVAEKLGNQEYIRKSRLHPLSILAALHTYSAGRGFKGSGSWEVNSDIVEALDRAFHLSFGNIEPTGKRIMIGLDVSSSMGRNKVGGLKCGITAAMAAAAMLMIPYRTERNIVARGFADNFRDLGITRQDSLKDVMRKTADLNFGGTDCSLPVFYAWEHGIKVDCFIVYTDNETWAGKIHPSQALRQYRQETGIAAKLIVVGMTANDVSIADPDDAGMMDVVGFDTAAPAAMEQFIKR